MLAASGARVVLGARRTDNLKGIAESIAAQGGDVRYKALDVTQLDDVKAFADFAASEFGRVDVIVKTPALCRSRPCSR